MKYSIKGIRCSDWSVNQWEEYLDLLQNWNSHHSLKNFVYMYIYNFSFYTIWQNPIWRIIRIIRYTYNGRYKRAEKEVYIRIEREKEREKYYKSLDK